MPHLQTPSLPRDPSPATLVDKEPTTPPCSDSRISRLARKARSQVTRVAAGAATGTVESLAYRKYVPQTTKSGICPGETKDEFYERVFFPDQPAPPPSYSVLLWIGVVHPICEELVFRYLLQDVILTKIPKYVVKKIAPGKETALDTTVAKAIRIVVTAVLFSGAHYSNDHLSPQKLCYQLVSTAVGGITLGILKESKAGLLGAVASHATFNMLGAFIKY